MSYDSANHFYPGNPARAQSVTATRSAGYYARPSYPSTASFPNFAPYNTYESRSGGYYRSYSDPHEQQRSMDANYYGESHGESLAYASKDSGAFPSMNDADDYPINHAAMSSQRPMTYSNSSSMPPVHPSLRHAQQPGDSHYPYSNAGMMHSRYPPPSRYSQPNDAGKAQAYPPQARYPSYSSMPNGHASAWPPVISTGAPSYPHPPAHAPSSTEDDANASRTKPHILEPPSHPSMSSSALDDVESSNSSFSDSQSTSNEKPAKKSKNAPAVVTAADVLSKLREMGNEPERNLFVDRLQQLWDEQHVACRKLPTLARRTIDLFRLYAAVREQNGFEQFSKVAKNRHWRDIALKLNIPHCSTAALTIKQKYLALKLFHYECKYDRGGIDPEPILTDMEKPKEKRATKASDEKPTKPSAELASSKLIENEPQSSEPSMARHAEGMGGNGVPQQVPTPAEHFSKVQLRPAPVSFPPDSVEATTLSTKFKRRKLTAKDLAPMDPQKLLMSLRGGLLAETTWALDTINVMLADDQTHTYFRLKHMPGLLPALVDIYMKCLAELFDEFRSEQSDQPADRHPTERESDCVLYRIESDCLNKYQWRSNRQHDVTVEHVYDQQGNTKNNPENVIDLQNRDDLCHIQTHLDPLHIRDQYYETLYHGHHSTREPSLDEHDQELDGTGERRSINDNDAFLRRHKRKSPSDEPLAANIDIDGQQENASAIFTRYSLGYDQTCARCTCVSSIVRNLSFVPGNELELAKYQPLIELLARLLLLRHDFQNAPSSDRQPDQAVNDCSRKNEERSASPSLSWCDCLAHIRENTLVTFTNIAGVLILDAFDSDLINQLVDGLLHWSTCLSAQRLSIEILSKLSIHEMNMDFILATPPFHRIISLFRILTDWLNVDETNASITRSDTYIQREFAIVLLNALLRCDSLAANVVNHLPHTISLLLTFLEEYERRTNELSTRYGPDYLMRVSNSQQAEQLLFTTNDMLKRAATCLLSIAHQSENTPSVKKHEDRILNLSMSNLIDRNVGRILTDILHYCSLDNS